MKKFALTALLVALIAGTAVAQNNNFPLRPATDTTPMTGKPTFIASGEIGLGGKRVVFHGVDPAMDRMPCEVDGRAWDCGAAAMRILLNFVGREEVTCEPIALDLFRRVFAKCTVHGKDIGMHLVEQGMAVAIPEESADYIEAEKAAKAKKVGMWRGRFKTPQEFRNSFPDPRPR